MTAPRSTQDSLAATPVSRTSMRLLPRHIACIFALLAVSATLLVCATLAGEVEGEPPAKEGPPTGLLGEFEGANVMEIYVRGAVRVTESQVLKMIRTRRGRPFEQKVWEEDWHRLNDSGYFLNVRITEPIKWPGGIKLTIDLVEKASIAKIEFKGSKQASGNKLKGVIKSIEGGRYDKGQVHLDKLAIEKHFQDQGYRNVKVDYSVEVMASHPQPIGTNTVEVEDEVRIIFTVSEGNSIAVRRICFVGNQAFSQGELEAIMQTKFRKFLRPGELKDDDLDNDKKRLEAFYLRHGYMDVQIQEIKVDVTKETAWNFFRKRKSLADVTIQITEGPQYFTGTVTMNGIEPNVKAELDHLMKVRPGAVFSDTLVLDDKQRISDWYGERGRPFTKVEYDRKLVTDPERLKHTPNVYDVTFNIKEGSEVTVREIIVRGNTKTRDKVINRQLELYPGERIDTTKIKIAIQRLKNLNYFDESDIRITPEATDNPEEANVIVDVTEKGTGEFNFGVGVSSVDSFVGNVSLTQRNFDWSNYPKCWRDAFTGNSFVGAGQNASVNVTAGLKRQSYVASLFEPWAFNRPIRLGGSIFHTVDNYQDFKDSDTGFSLTAGRRLWGPRWDGDITYRFSYTSIDSSNRKLPPILADQNGSSLINSIKPRIVYDSRDSTILPSRGWIMEASSELGFGSHNFIKPQADAAHYITVYKLKDGGKHILSLHGHLSAIEGLGSGEVAPFLRLYGGGIDTIRGFNYRALTPFENGYAIGAKRFNYASAEYSLPLYEELVRGSMFVDTGSAYDGGHADPHTEIVNDKGLRTTVGVGLSIRTPFSPAPVRIYISRPVQKNTFDRTKIIDFTLGTRF